jgi:hypothetical protein
MGYHLKTQLTVHGSFTTAMVDAITRTSSQFDEIAYGAKGSRWRHFLPAHFAVSTLPCFRKRTKTLSGFTPKSLNVNRKL